MLSARVRVWLRARAGVELRGWVLKTPSNILYKKRTIISNEICVHLLVPVDNIH